MIENFNFMCNSKEEGFAIMVDFLNDNQYEYVAHDFSEGKILIVYKRAT